MCRVEVPLTTRTTLKELWEQWEKAILDPVQAGSVQRSESRRAFYDGAGALWALMNSVGPDDVSEDAGVALMERLQAELDQYVADLRAGKH